MKRPVPRYEKEVILNFGANVSKPEVAVVPDQNTSITVSYFNGVDYTTHPTKIEHPDTLFVRGCMVKLTPSSGGFFIDDSEAYKG
ncbi:hypothetical protein vBVpaS1601_22 [Vibrio phage vB_VpaS_1601]|uniref:hypothetical protein n=1 Tax=Vibrio phage SHOU24 TaxID=1414739 RepID=UPI0003ED1F2D|nr:hypothetical protein SHOU24_64 [Vibrio phage SHOU24]AHI61261.1 hypothetical protein SHOU24_64 [Vibrio phage SHOU24]WHM52715.1 hypothetical protein vBVpaP1601_22 [Vibrio phage vB_VpaP_1601]